MADPEEYRTKDEVEEWRERDPIQAFAKRLQDEGVVSKEQFEEFDEKAIATVDEAVKFADESPFPDLDSLYDDVYVVDSDVPAWWTVDERSPEVHRGEQEREAGELPHKLAEAGAAYANVGDKEARSRRQKSGDEEEKDEDGDEKKDEDAQAQGEDETEARGDESGEEQSGDDESGDDSGSDEVDEPGEGEGSGDDAGEGEPSGDEPEAEGGAD
jgi:hypothetical protein